MNTEIMLLTEENRDPFEPCIMPDIWQHIGDNDVFGYGIAEENSAVGAVVCSYNDGIINLLSLGVSPDCHRRGFARQLLGHLEQVCSVNGFYEINARYFMSEQERVPLEALLTSCGYSLLKGEFKQIVFTLGTLKGSRAEQQMQKSQAAGAMKKLVPFGKLDQQQQQWLLEQVSILWEERSRLSPSRSCVSVRNGQIVGAVLVSEEAGMLEIVQLYSAQGEDVASMICLFATMGEAYSTMSPDTMVRFRAEGDIANNLVDKLLNNCTITTIYEQIAYRSVPVLATVTEDE